MVSYFGAFAIDIMHHFFGSKYDTSFQFPFLFPFIQYGVFLCSLIPFLDDNGNGKIMHIITFNPNRR